MRGTVFGGFLLIAPRSGAFIQTTVKKWFRAFLVFYNVILVFLALVFLAKQIPKRLTSLSFLRAALWRRPAGRPSSSYYDGTWSIWHAFFVPNTGRKNSVLRSANVGNVMFCVACRFLRPLTQT